MLMMIAALAALLQAQTPVRTDEPASAETFAGAREALDKALLDYPTARFRDVVASRRVVCGKVNSKNRMGAYAGWSDFVVYVDEEPTAFIDDDIMMDALCNERNRPQSPDYSEQIRKK